jgi:hypothetical protein
MSRQLALDLPWQHAFPERPPTRLRAVPPLCPRSPRRSLVGALAERLGPRGRQLMLDSAEAALFALFLTLALGSLWLGSS